MCFCINTSMCFKINIDDSRPSPFRTTVLFILSLYFHFSMSSIDAYTCPMSSFYYPPYICHIRLDFDCSA
jgi:hypothetical protein